MKYKILLNEKHLKHKPHKSRQSKAFKNKEHILSKLNTARPPLLVIFLFLTVIYFYDVDYYIFSIVGICFHKNSLVTDALSDCLLCNQV